MDRTPSHKARPPLLTASEMRVKPSGNGNIIAGGYSTQTGQTLYRQSYNNRAGSSLGKHAHSKIDLT